MSCVLYDYRWVGSTATYSSW